MADAISVFSLTFIVFEAEVFGKHTRGAWCGHGAPLCGKPVLTLGAPAPSGPWCISFLCQNGSHNFKVEIQQ